MSNALGPSGNRAPLVSYTTPNRASLVPESSRKKEPAAFMKRKKGGKQSKSKKIRLVKGKLQLRVQGYDGVQRIPSSHLIRFIPSAKLRLAAKKVLKLQGGGKKKGKGKKSKKGKKSRKGKKGRKGRKGRKGKKGKKRKKKRSKKK